MSPIKRQGGGRLREDVRIRLGERIEVVKDGEVQLDKDGKPKTKPVALKTFRFTSQRREPLDRLAAVYGGDVREWHEPSTQDRWQLTSEAQEIDAFIPPAGGFSQYYERWKGGGCERRCDGDFDLITRSPCDCPADGAERSELAKSGKACKERTRIVVILPQTGELAGARVETGSYYAAEELAFTEELFAGAMAQGVFIPVRLRIAPRRSKRPGQAAREYTVVEFIAKTTDAMAAIGTVGDRAAGELESGPTKLEQARATHARRAANGPAPQERPAAAGAPRQAPAAARPRRTDVSLETVDELVKVFHGAGLRDDEAAQVVGLVTGGRTTNLKTLEGPELQAVTDVATRMRAGFLELVFDGEDAQLVDREGNQVDATGGETRVIEAKEYSGVWWSQRIRSAGISQGNLLRRARALAGELEIDVPKAIDELTDEKLAAALSEWVAEQLAKAEAS